MIVAPACVPFYLMRMNHPHNCHALRAALPSESCGGKESAPLGSKQRGFCAHLLVPALIAIACAILLLTRPSLADPANPTTRKSSDGSSAPSLEQMRLATDKWLETQKIIFKERNEWQQGKEILLGRIELVEKEIAALEEKIKQAKSSVADADQKQAELVAENDQLKATFAELTKTATAMEADVRKLFRILPEPTQKKLQPLHQRIPEAPATTRAALAERYQNVLGILNEVNKTNNEIFVNYEVHTLANGKPVEVQAIYIGLSQAYYVSATGEAGICHPGLDGWKWEPRNAIGRQLLNVLEILQGKQTAAFVPLPVKIQ